jgi:serine/threonine protein phosphatase PrpC
MSDGTVEMSVPQDERLGFGVTTSLCDSDAADNFRHYYAKTAEGFEAVILCTDGVVDSFTPDSFPRVNQKILDEMKNNKESAEAQLKEWLPILSERGSQDDASIAGVYAVGVSKGQET